MQIDILGCLVAIFVAAGGIFGYYKAGSVPSLCAGLIFGIILAVGAYFTSQSPRKPLLQLLTLLVLALMMFFRWYKSAKIMPAGVIALVSSGVFIINLILFYEDLKNQVT